MVCTCASMATTTEAAHGEWAAATSPTASTCKIVLAFSSCPLSVSLTLKASLLHCRDGGNADGSGYVGARVYGNIISSALGGAVFIHGGGNVNFSNNIVVDTSVPGEFWGAVSIAAVNNASVEKRPGSHFDRNIFVVVLPPGIDTSTCHWGQETHPPCPDCPDCPTAIGGSFWEEQNVPGQPGSVKLWAGSDHNLFWSPNGAPIRFTKFGMNLCKIVMLSRFACCPSR